MPMLFTRYNFFSEDAFLFSVEYFEAMCVCLEAVEENKASLLAEINPKLVCIQKLVHACRPSDLWWARVIVL